MLWRGDSVEEMAQLLIALIVFVCYPATKKNPNKNPQQMVPSDHSVM